LTQAEVAWVKAILNYGCIACRKDGYGYEPASVHHLIKGGKRMGHLFTIPLCIQHHQYGAISRHRNHKGFNAKYGTEMELYEEMKAIVAKMT
jgi:hypothetical protein